MIYVNVFELYNQNGNHTHKVNGKESFSLYTDIDILIDSYVLNNLNTKYNTFVMFILHSNYLVLSNVVEYIKKSLNEKGIKSYFLQTKIKDWSKENLLYVIDFNVDNRTGLFQNPDKFSVFESIINIDNELSESEKERRLILYNLDDYLSDLFNNYYVLELSTVAYLDNKKNTADQIIELLEESNIKVSNIDYHNSKPDQAFKPFQNIKNTAITIGGIIIGIKLLDYFSKNKKD